MSHSISFISVANYTATFKKYRVNFWSSVCPHGTYFSWVLVLFQFFEDLIRTHAACQQFLQHTLGFSLLSFFSDLCIYLCLLHFQRCHFFFGLLQSNFLLFQVSKTLTEKSERYSKSKCSLKYLLTFLHSDLLEM